MLCPAAASALLTSAGTSGTSGQPLFLATPGTSGHLSSSSLMPSLSLSATGQPLLLAGPAWLGHLSSSSLIPSPSVSGMGQPLYRSKPTSFGHLSFLSITPSPSESASTFFPNNLNFKPACMFWFLYFISSPGV